MKALSHIWSTIQGKISLAIIGLWIILGCYALAPWRSAIGNTIDASASGYKPPFFTSENEVFHPLGTDLLGRDILSGIVDGAYYSLVLCMVTIFLSLIIGIIYGLVAGYFGDKGLKANSIQLIWSALLLFTLIYGVTYGFMGWGMGAIALLLWGAGCYGLSRVGKRNIGIPLDIGIMKLVEVKNSIPALIIILFFAGLMGHMSILGLAVILAFFYHLTYARYVRNETIIQRSEDYIASAEASGIGSLRIMFTHLLPNVIAPLLVVVAFSLSSIILIESTLSFLGIGIGVEEVTWGKILAQARSKPSAWWMAVFPGLCITALIYAFNHIGNSLSLYLSGREKVMLLEN